MNLTKNARRCAVAVAVPALLLTVASCGSDSKSGSKNSASSSSSSSSDGGSGAVASVSGKFGEAPVIKIDTKKAGAAGKNVKTFIKGTGTTVKKGDYVRVDTMMRAYKTPQALLNTYVKGQSGQKQQYIDQAGSGQMGQLYSPVAAEALVGQKVGSRVLVQGSAKVMMPDTYQQMGLTADQVFDWVIDVQGTASVSSTAEVTGTQAKPDSGMPVAKVPTQKANLKKDATTGQLTDPKKIATITVPKGAKAPTKLEQQTLIKGSGSTVKAGQGLIAQYTGVTFDKGTMFDSSWKHGGATAFQIGTGSVIKGWDQALVGKKVGDRVLIVIPKDLAYGKTTSTANAAAGHDLVFVVDIVGTV